MSETSSLPRLPIDTDTNSIDDDVSAANITIKSNNYKYDCSLLLKLNYCFLFFFHK